VHGGNRLGANSLLETVVFGRRAGLAAAAYAAERPMPTLSPALARDERARLDAIVRRPPGERAATLRLEMGRTMTRHVGVFRDEAGLREAQATIARLRERWSRVAVDDKGRVFNQALVSVLELDFMLDLAETVVASALFRTESRGAHSRLDYPQRDDARWLKHILCYRTDEGPRLDTVPVTITRWQPAERVY